MATSGIVNLFAKYRLTKQISGLRNFENFMAIVKNRHQSVWELKRFTRLDIPNPLNAVIIDYGFWNCKDARQRMQLRELYQTYFENREDEIRLHEACIAGKLAIFLEPILGRLVSPLTDVLNSPYPWNDPLAGMVMVTDVAIMCPESSVDSVRALKAADGEKGVIMTYPDAEDEAWQHVFRHRAAFLGTGVKTLYRTGPDGSHIMQLMHRV